MEFCGTLFRWRFIRCVVSALERVLKNSSVEQILLGRKAMLKGMDCLLWDGSHDDFRRC